jgi:hypothetical protein
MLADPSGWFSRSTFFKYRPKNSLKLSQIHDNIFKKHTTYVSDLTGCDIKKHEIDELTFVLGEPEKADTDTNERNSKTSCDSQPRVPETIRTSKTELPYCTSCIKTSRHGEVF